MLGAPGVGAAVATPPSLGAEGQRPRARSEAAGNGTISWGFHGDLLVIYWGFSGIFLGCSGIDWRFLGIYQIFNGVSW